MPGRLIYLMGPSGSGKDSLIDAARGALEQLHCDVVRRVITRSAESVGEDAQGVSADEFDRLEQQGAFALSWRANDLAYGIPAEIDEWLAAGRNVLVNGSRAYLEQARQHYPQLLAILLTVNPEVLRQRLVGRGRESVVQIEARLKRSAAFSMGTGATEGGPVFSLDNSGELSMTLKRFLTLLVAQGISAGPDRT
ncbi:phosphonate metabolism protein/1,5-bisphosphokinase (PRPP-forming) PhnN [Pseudomonas chlororaphis]|uniref:phosphonate metabolism protein/1,5-bisphosphokinase (PRPP-forming) PhnN n=1 Tax=Pseudomonas chlororaphis TaxID=587753 RepID=UPI001E2955AC|nr:phosphonate metabolism protein/1,5-bisphosphokinase (PRPP-forming) PhnN [Pseudomonas chlororaphis]MCB2251492.1 phosphonate metabolism protein/1,5-bisphosphokinase (PRPP-forming) PhnN [Pseudomonas chlororaphis]